MKTHNQFICNLAPDDPEEQAEEDGVVREDAGEVDANSGRMRRRNYFLYSNLYYLYLVREAIANPGRMKRMRGRSGEKTLVP